MPAAVIQAWEAATVGASSDHSLYGAVVRQDGEAVRSLLAAGSEPNARGQAPWGHTALQEAIIRGNRPIAELLLASGANPNASGRRGWEKHTVLHEAVQKDELELALLLLRKGADPDARDRWGSTPLDRYLQRRNNKISESDRSFLVAWVKACQDGSYEKAIQRNTVNGELEDLRVRTHQRLDELERQSNERFDNIIK